MSATLHHRPDHDRQAGDAGQHQDGQHQRGVLCVQTGTYTEGNRVARLRCTSARLLDVVASHSPAMSTHAAITAALWPDAEDPATNRSVALYWMNIGLTEAGIKPLVSTIRATGLRLVRPVLVLKPPVAIPHQAVIEIESLLLSHPERARADRALAAMIGA